jgi:hypothetical protein
MEFNGIQPFVVIWSTGYVLSEKAIREIGIEGLQAEYGPFTSSDVVKLIPTEDELSRQRQEMETRRAISKAEKKDGKKKRSHELSGVEVGSEAAPSDSAPKKAAKTETNSTATTTSGPMKPSSFNNNGSAGKITAACSLAKQATEAVQQQESKSSVFKSLFHKSGEADKKDRDLFMSVAGIRYTLK